MTDALERLTLDDKGLFHLSPAEDKTDFDTIADLKAQLAAERTKVAALVEALTPSGETKAAYIGEFSFANAITGEDGNEVTVRVMVPWATVKEIMAAIRTRAITAARGVGNE